VLREEIKIKSDFYKCQFCKRKEKSIHLHDLADRVDDVYMNIISKAQETPNPTISSDHVHYSADGEKPTIIVQRMLKCEENLAEAVVGILSRKHERSVMDDREIDWYDNSSSVYEVFIPRDPEFKETWNSFCESVKHRRRFFNPSACAHLDKILGTVLKEGWLGSKSPIRMIGGG